MQVTHDDIRHEDSEGNRKDVQAYPRENLVIHGLRCCWKETVLFERENENHIEKLRLILRNEDEQRRYEGTAKLLSCIRSKS